MKTKNQSATEKAAKSKKPIRGRPPLKLERDFAEELKDECTRNPRFYSLHDVIRILGISTATASRWLKEGRFVGVTWAASTWLFDVNFQIREGRSDGRIAEMSKRLLPTTTTSEGEPNAN